MPGGVTIPGVTAMSPVALPATPEPVYHPIVRTPEPRPSGFEDPETLANRAGGSSLAAAPAPPESSAIAPDGRKIRVVGPPDYMVTR